MVQFQQQMMEGDAAQEDRGEDGDNSDLEVVDVVSARPPRQPQARDPEVVELSDSEEEQRPVSPAYPPPTSAVPAGDDDVVLIISSDEEDNVPEYRPQIGKLNHIHVHIHSDHSYKSIFLCRSDANDSEPGPGDNVQS